MAQMVVYYTSGNGGASTALMVQIDPGTSYVGGYKREILSSKRLTYNETYNVRYKGITTYFHIIRQLH